MDTVFIALSYILQNGMPVLDLALNNFQNDKTKFILTFIDEDQHIQAFKDLAERHYLPRCRAKQFKAQIMTPQQGHLTPLVLDLIIRNGMKKFVIDVAWTRRISAIFDEMNYLSCKIWFVDYNRELIFVRSYGPDPDLQNTSYRDIPNLGTSASQV